MSELSAAMKFALNIKDPVVFSMYNPVIQHTVQTFTSFNDHYPPNKANQLVCQSLFFQDLSALLQTPISPLRQTEMLMYAPSLPLYFFGPEFCNMIHRSIMNEIHRTAGPTVLGNISTYNTYAQYTDVSFIIKDVLTYYSTQYGDTCGHLYPLLFCIYNEVFAKPFTDFSDWVLVPLDLPDNSPLKEHSNYLFELKESDAVAFQLWLDMGTMVIQSLRDYLRAALVVNEFAEFYYHTVHKSKVTFDYAGDINIHDSKVKRYIEAFSHQSMYVANRRYLYRTFIANMVEQLSHILDAGITTAFGVVPIYFTPHGWVLAICSDQLLVDAQKVIPTIKTKDDLIEHLVASEHNPFSLSDDQTVFIMSSVPSASIHVTPVNSGAPSLKVVQ